MMTIGIQNLLPKFQVNQTKIECAMDNFLFLKLATSRASYDCHLLNDDKWYSKLAPEISGQLDQN